MKATLLRFFSTQNQINRIYFQDDNWIPLVEINNVFRIMCCFHKLIFKMYALCYCSVSFCHTNFREVYQQVTYLWSSLHTKLGEEEIFQHWKMFYSPHLKKMSPEQFSSPRQHPNSHSPCYSKYSNLQITHIFSG